MAASPLVQPTPRCRPKPEAMLSSSARTSNGSPSGSSVDHQSGVEFVADPEKCHCSRFPYGCDSESEPALDQNQSTLIAARLPLSSWLGRGP